MNRMLFVAALACAALAPIVSLADTKEKTVNYTTTIHETYPNKSPGAITGYLNLTFYSSGIVKGTYRNESSGGFKSVSGGYKGTEIWFSGAALKFRGQIVQHGALHGSVTGWRGPATGEMVATPHGAR